MKYLKLLAVLFLSITLAACGDKSDEESADTKDENKTEETAETETENTDTADDTADSDSATEGDTESESESDDADTDTDSSDDSTESDNETDDSATEEEVVSTSEKEYKIGDDTTPLLGTKAIEFGEELEGKEESSLKAQEIIAEAPDSPNYILNNYLIMRVKNESTTNYDATVTRSMVDEADPAKIYTEVADKHTGEFRMFNYEENGKAYVYDQGSWVEFPLEGKDHVMYGLAENLVSIADENNSDFKVFEDDDQFYLEYSGPENELTKSISDSYNVRYTKVDLNTLKYNVLYSFDKEDKTLDDFIFVSRVKGQNPNETLQIEVHVEFDDYGNHPASKITKPQGL